MVYWLNKGRKYDMKINAKKTKVTVIGRNAEKEVLNIEEVDTKRLEQVYRY